MQFSKAIETEWQGVLDFKAVTIMDPAQADVIREKHRERVISSRLVLRWKETDTGYKAKARWCVHGFKVPDIHETERSCPTPELSSINITLQILASTMSEGTLADGEKAFMQGDPSVGDEPSYATPPPEGLPGVPEGELIRLDREVYGLVSGMSGWRSRIVSQLKEEGYEMNVYEPCLFSKFAVREEPSVDGGSIAPGEFVGCVLLEVDDHLMGGPGKAHHESMERLRQRIKIGKWHRWLQDGPSFFGGRHFTQLPDRSFKVDMTRFIRERLRPVSLPRGRCLDRSDEASEGEVKALRAVAGSLSWIARQCRPDEAGTASTLQGSVSRAVEKDLSDANRAVKRLKQTEDVGLLIHAIPLANLRIVSISDAALDLDRPDGSTQGGFMVGFTTSAPHKDQQSCHPMSWSSHKVKRSVSASLAGEVSMMSEGLAECEWISGVLESAVYQDYEPSLHRRKSISLPVEPTVTVMKADSHLQIDPSTVCVIDAKSVFDHLVRESTGGHCRRTAQELCVIRRSMQTLRARCRWVPHERMVVDALTKRHGNSVAMLRLLRDGVLSIVDGDRELAMRKVYRETHKHNLRPHKQVEQAQTGEYDRRNAVGCSHTIKADEASGSDP